MSPPVKQGERIKQVLALRAEGLSCSEVARRLQITKGVVSGIVYRYGVQVKVGGIENAVMMSGNNSMFLALLAGIKPMLALPAPSACLESELSPIVSKYAPPPVPIRHELRETMQEKLDRILNEIAAIERDIAEYDRIVGKYVHLVQ